MRNNGGILHEQPDILNAKNVFERRTGSANAVMQNRRQQPEYAAELHDSRYTALGQLLKSAMTEQSLSMRKLSTLSGICVSTISRIVNNMQTAGLHHIWIFSKHLNIPLEQLLTAAGTDYDGGKNDDSFLVLEIIQDALSAHGVDLYRLVIDVRRELCINTNSRH